MDGREYRVGRRHFVSIADINTKLGLRRPNLNQGTNGLKVTFEQPSMAGLEDFLQYRIA
ncbi:hypothetical protein J6590_003336 [Homalodisca vitripennis]|nr:hypothetical protein J6590_003336 [Homalodisca vitripennis]